MPPSQNSAQALSALQTYQGGLKQPQDILKSTQDRLGVGAAQQQVSGLRQAINNTTNLLKQVAPGVMGRTGNSLVTSSQANKMIQNEQTPIAEQLGQQGQDYDTANSDLSRLFGQANTETASELQGQSNQLSFLQSIYDALFKQEQEAERKRAEAERFAEEKRQFDAQLAAARSGGGIGGIGATSGLSNQQIQELIAASNTGKKSPVVVEANRPKSSILSQVGPALAQTAQQVSRSNWNPIGGIGNLLRKIF